ncbi:M949_RS01915 family surface polysaccharide biosynthesis protein [Variovorax sp. W6]|uniref:M949_RS01915 family surface polysaccharide biosynthesis protein n=1 Tax=Variovorax sp. W6 TaxID=3093895 RepID=UPI003D80A25F
MKGALLAAALLASLAMGSQAQTPPGKDRNECPATAPYLNADVLKKAGFELPVFKRYCYSDKAGSHVLLLGEKQDLPFPEEKLSSAIQATLYKVGADNASLTPEWSIRDFAGKDEAGLNFRSKLVELDDIDGDGLVDPVLVYRFFEHDGADRIDNDDFVGRIKIVVFHQGRKATIHAITGHLDGDRRTTANGNYFALPKPVQQHLVKKMAAMYKAGQFGFDNSYDFVPRREGARR